MIPVITIDGTSGCGKGTLAHALARHLSWHYLDSGALYRIVAFAATHYQVTPEDNATFADFIIGLNITFKDAEDLSGFRVFCNDMDVSHDIRTPETGRAASIVSAMPHVRQALFDLQLSFRKAPGLVTDGRDMGTVVFPDAPVKLFLTASIEERASRRYHQLVEAGDDVSYNDIVSELKERDMRDQSRQTAPLKPADDAVLVDTSSMSIQDVFDLALSHIK